MADHSREDQGQYYEGFDNYDRLPPDDPFRAANEGLLLGKKAKKRLSIARLREQPWVLVAGGAGGILVAAVIVWLLIGWFGGSDSGAERESRVARQLVPPGAEDPEKQNSAAPPPAELPAEAPEDPAQQPAPPVVEPEGPPPRPDDVAQWKKEDYFSARIEGDPRLLEAVDHLAQFVDSASVAEGLTELLKTPPPPPEPDRETAGRWGGRHHVPRISRELTQKIIDALVSNQTDAARAALLGLLEGTFPAEDAPSAGEAVIQSLRDHPSPRHEAILLEIATRPDTPDPSGSARQFGRQGPRQQVLAILNEQGSAELRAKLADYLLRPSTPPQQRETLSGMLLEKKVVNLAAQAILYQSDQIPGSVRATLRDQFSEYGATLMQHVLGLPTNVPRGHQPRRRAAVDGWGRPAPAAAPRSEADSERPYRIARELWSPALVEAFARRLEEVGSLKDQDAALVKLAATMPVDELRSGVHRVLRRHWQLGPQGLAAVGLPGEAITDPGLLLSLKAMPRIDPDDAVARMRPPGHQPVPRYGHRAPMAQPDAEEQAKIAWTEASQALVEAWCRRLHAAADAARQEGVLKSLPIGVHPDAGVTAQHRISWPGGDRRKYAGLPVGPMLVHYVRIEETNRPGIVEGFYRRTLRVRDMRPLRDGVWIDLTKPVPDTPRTLSVDVLIRRANPSQDPGGRQPEDLRIEILTVEMNSPTGDT